MNGNLVGGSSLGLLLSVFMATVQAFGAIYVEAVDVARVFQEVIADTAENLIHAKTFLIY